MFLKSLQIENLRNIARVDLAPNPHLNLLYGPNGAGKTSILESIMVLSRGRSFRTTQAGELTGPGGEYFRVVAQTVNAAEHLTRLGLERSGKRWRARKDGLDLSQLSQLTRSLPLVLMEPNTHLLVSGPPDGRRKYLDWGLFHVEPQFLDTWRRFTKILKQRNAALRSKREDVLESIDNVFIELGLKLERLRQAHTVSVKDKVLVLLKKLSPDLNLIGLEYQLGWSGNSLDEALAVCRESDFQRGATGVGPHRADVVLTCRGTVARNILSRGEQKILSAALILAQAEILADLGETPIILLDDLESEFDQEHFDRVLESALGIGGQVWVSGTRKHSFGGEHKVFHVKHGEVSEMV